MLKLNEKILTRAAFDWQRSGVCQSKSTKENTGAGEDLEIYKEKFVIPQCDGPVVPVETWTSCNIKSEHQ